MGSDVGERLLQAWLAWDAQPRSAGTAHAMEDACGAAARELGWTSSQLRDRLSVERRAGRTHRQALERLGLVDRA